jgi:hypothetical protein
MDGGMCRGRKLKGNKISGSQGLMGLVYKYFMNNSKEN